MNILYLYIYAGLIAPFSAFIASRRGLEHVPIVSALLFIPIGCINPSIVTFIFCQIICGVMIILVIFLKLFMHSKHEKGLVDSLENLGCAAAVGIQFLFFSLLFGGAPLFIRYFLQ